MQVTIARACLLSSTLLALGCGMSAAAEPDLSTTRKAEAAPVGDSGVLDEYVDDDAYLCGQQALAPSVLLDTGDVRELYRAGDRLLSRSYQQWVLWDVTTRQQIARGPAGPSRQGTRRDRPSIPAAIAGETLMIGTPDGPVELRHARDGRLLVTLPAMIDLLRGSGIAPDGSFVYR